MSTDAHAKLETILERIGELLDRLIADGRYDAAESLAVVADGILAILYADE